MRLLELLLITALFSPLALAEDHKCNVAMALFNFPTLPDPNLPPFPLDSLPLHDDTQLLYFGEFHFDMAPKRGLIDHLRTFKNRGFSAIGVECVKTNHQSELDAFFEGKRSQEDVEKLVLDDFQWSSDAWAQLFAAARAEGIRIVALNAPNEMQEGWKKAGISMGERILGMRDTYSVETIQKWMADHPGEKMISFWGLDHLLANAVGPRDAYSPVTRDIRVSQQQRALQAGIKTQTFIYAGDPVKWPGTAYPLFENLRQKTGGWNMKSSSELRQENVDGAIFALEYSDYLVGLLKIQLGY